jgi:hypothetical protein
LTAKLQLRAISRSACEARGLAPPSTAVAALRGPGGAMIDDSSALHLPPPALFAPRRARDIASDIPCSGSPRTAPPREWRLDPLRFVPMPSDHVPFGSPRHLVKEWHIASNRTPSVVRVAPSPCRADAFAPARGITRSPPPVSLRACWWLSPPRSGFRRRFTRCARRPLGLRASELDPWSFDRGPSAARRLLQPPQSASTTA